MKLGKRLRINRAVALLPFALLLVAPSANAVAWGTLNTYNDGYWVASGSGTYVNNAYAYQRLNSTYYDRRVDGSGAYVVVSHRYFYGGTWQFHYNGTAESPRISTTSSPRSWSNQAALKSDGEQARGHVKICIDEAYEYDACSVTAYPTFSY